jgi:putative heme-binding domain-containing protein
VATLTEQEKTDLKSILEAKSTAPTPVIGLKRDFVKKWKLADLAASAEKGMTNRDFDRGRRLFGEARCFACHRFDNEGGSQGPDLTGSAGRFSVRDLLESIIDPNKEISDQYAATIFTTTDGRRITGRIVNYHGDNASVMTNMLEPNTLISLNTKNIEAVERSKVSPMPEDLFDTFKEDEILDLMAYLLSRGDRSHKMFQR